MKTCSSLSEHLLKKPFVSTKYTEHDHMRQMSIAGIFDENNVILNVSLSSMPSQ